MNSESVRFLSEGHMLQGILSQRESQKKTSVLILHPHPLYGGDMKNHVVLTLERIFLEHGFTTFRFDFRGASSNPRGYSGIRGAITDALNAIAHLKSLTRYKKVAVVGYSFGASVGIRLALIEPPPFLISLSASKGLIVEDDFDINELIDIECPTLMFHGREDDMISFRDLLDLAEIIRHDSISREIIDGEGHFYQKSLPFVEKAIREFIAALYK